MADSNQTRMTLKILVFTYICGCDEATIEPFLIDYSKNEISIKIRNIKRPWDCKTCTKKKQKKWWQFWKEEVNKYQSNIHWDSKETVTEQDLMYLNRFFLIPVNYLRGLCSRSFSSSTSVKLIFHITNTNSTRKKDNLESIPDLTKTLLRKNSFEMCTIENYIYECGHIFPQKPEKCRRHCQTYDLVRQYARGNCSRCLRRETKKREEDAKKWWLWCCIFWICLSERRPAWSGVDCYSFCLNFRTWGENRRWRSSIHYTLDILWLRNWVKHFSKLISLEQLHLLWILVR